MLLSSESDSVLPQHKEAKRKPNQSCLASLCRPYKRAVPFILILIFVQATFILSVIPPDGFSITSAAIGQSVAEYLPPWSKITSNAWTSSKVQRTKLEVLAASRLSYLQSILSRDRLAIDLAIKNPAYSLQDYQSRLRHYYDDYFGPLNGAHSDIWAEVEKHLIPGRVVDEAVPQVIHSATKDHANVSKPFSKWKQDHPTWKVNVYDEDEREASVREAFAALGRSSSKESNFLEEFNRLPYPMLKIDTFRYLKTFLEGGIWSDGDAGSVYNVLDWPGMRGPEPGVVVQRQDDILHFLEAMPRLGVSSSTGPYEDVWSGNPSTPSNSRQKWTPPGLAFAVEFDAPHSGKNWKKLSLSRPLQMAQAIFMAKQFHPVLLDCVGTIMTTFALYKNKTLPTSPKGQEYTQLVLDWTG
jgi:hypothetical protein